MSVSFTFHLAVEVEPERPPVYFLFRQTPLPCREESLAFDFIPPSAASQCVASGAVGVSTAGSAR